MNETITVYFESKNHAEQVAVFYDETYYLACLPSLEAQAASSGMIVTETTSLVPIN